MTRPLWTCPRCGAKLVSRNLSHACGEHSVAAFLARAGAKGRALYTRFVTLIARCGPYHVAPAKTRVAFLARVRFASVNRVRDEAIDVHFVLPRRIASPRFRRIERLGKLYVHHLRLSRAAEFNRELAGWLRAAYTEYGERTWLERRPAAPVNPVRRSLPAPAAPRTGDRPAAPRTGRRP